MPTNIRFRKEAVSTDLGNLPGLLECQEDTRGLEWITCRLVYEATCREDAENYARNLATAFNLIKKPIIKDFPRSSSLILDNGLSGSIEKYNEANTLTSSLENCYPWELKIEDKGGTVLKGSLIFVRCRPLNS